jgi:hypothetical protein
MSMKILKESPKVDLYWDTAKKQFCLVFPNYSSWLTTSETKALADAITDALCNHAQGRLDQ